MDPPTTLWSLIGIAAMLGAAIAGRRRWPRFSAAILFFLAAHLLESSAIPLELSFEHRNYLPSALLAWPVASAMAAWRRPAWQRALVMATVVALLATITWQRTSLWGNPSALAATWAIRNPESARAQAAWALDRQQTASPATTFARRQPLWEKDPANVQIAVNAFDAACRSRRLVAGDLRLLGDTARTASADYDLLRQWLADRIIDDGDCLSTYDIHRLLAAAATNPGFNSIAGGARNLMPLQAALALHEHRPDVALAYFNRSFLADPRPETAFNQAALMAAQGAFAQALAHIDFYERHRASLAKPRAGMPWLHGRVLAWQHYWPRQFATLRRGIESARRANGTRHPGGVGSS
jgi:hypothetical protein